MAASGPAVDTGAMKIAIAGFGFMGQMHAKVYQALPGIEIAGIVDSFPDAQADVKRAGLAAPVSASLADLLASTQVDVVDICLPTDLHADAVILAANAGKHIFCEKPLALDLTEAERALAAVEKKGGMFQVGHCIRFWPEYQALEKFMRSGRGGKLISLALQRRASRPSYSRNDWVTDPTRSKGAVLDLHIHDTDYVLHLLGTPRSVQSIGRLEQGDWSRIFTHYHFDDVVVAAEGGWDFPASWGFQMAFQAVFENAVIEYDSRSSPSLHLTIGGELRQPLAFDKPVVASAGPATGNISDLGGYYNELASFCSSIRAGKPPTINTGRQALESLRVVLAEIKSVREKKAVSL
jgi:predicted dehydrogenase